MKIYISLYRKKDDSDAKWQPWDAYASQRHAIRDIQEYSQDRYEEIIVRVTDDNIVWKKS